MVFAAVSVFGFMAVMVMIMVWAERKVLGHLQSRIGPLHTGKYFGWAQSIADVLKLLMKEDIVPRDIDRPVYKLAPVVVFAAAFMAYVTIPFGKLLVAQNVHMGIVYVLAVSSIGTIGIFMAGWGSNNKWSLLGGMRAAAQIVSYEVPMLLSILGVLMIAESVSLKDIVAAQSGAWFVLYQPLGFLVFFTAGMAEINRLPFDIPEAESELVAGFHTEYSGMRFALFFLAEYASMFIMAALTTVLFLGGWHGPLLPDFVWFLLKVSALMILMVWIRGTWPRTRVDQLMNFCWKVLLPLAFLNLLVTGLIMSLFL
jgi:NADH-quinone oxidoreductase subunit H